MARGFDTRVWGATGWNVLYELAYCVDGSPKYSSEIKERLPRFIDVVLLYTQLLPCEPCRLNFAHKVFTFIQPRLVSMLESEPTDGYYKEIVALINEARFDVVVKKVANSGGTVMPIPDPGADASLIRELKTMESTSVSSTRIADFFSMMAAQVDCKEADARKTQLRTESFVRFLDTCQFLYGQNPPLRGDLVKGIRDAIRHASTPVNVRRMAHAVRTSIDGLPISSDEYFKFLDELRGPPPPAPAAREVESRLPRLEPEARPSAPETLNANRLHHFQAGTYGGYSDFGSWTVHEPHVSRSAPDPRSEPYSIHRGW
jgi:hypothetical protein